MSRTKFSILLAILLLAFSALRLWQLDADAPTDVSKDLSLSIDGTWYAAPALDRVIGRKNDVTSAYDRPLYSGYAWVLYRLFDPDLATTNFLSVPPGIIAVLFAALLGRLLYGSEAGLLAGLLLGANYSFLVFNRSPIVYSCVAMFSAITLYLSVKGSRERRLAPVIGAWVVFLGSTLFLKEISLFLLPPLLLGWPVRDRLRVRDRRWWFALAAGAAILATGAWFFEIHSKLFQKFNDYFLREKGSDVFQRLLDFENRSGLFRAAPWMTGLAVLSCVCRPLNREEKMVAGYSLGGILMFAPFSYSPLRYMIMFLPALAVLAAGLIRDLLAGAFARPPATGAPRPKPWKIALLAYFSYQCCLFLAPGSWMLRCVLWLALAVLVPVLVARYRDSLRSVVLKPALGAICLALLLMPQFYRTGKALAEPRFTVAYSLRDMECIVSSGAVLSGLYAHLLTMENRMERKLVPAVRFGKGQLKIAYEKRGITHLTLPIDETTPEVLARFQVDGAGLIPVHAFHIRETAVGLYRFPWAETSYELSPYERGIDAFRRKNLEQATVHFRASVDQHPSAGAPRSALAEVLLARGRVREAAFQLDRAIELNPTEVRPLALKARLLLNSGRSSQARPLLERILSLDPGNRSVRELLQALRSGTAIGASASRR